MLLIETLSTVGMFLLLYVVLPYMNALTGLFLLSGIGLIPSFLMLFNRPQSSKTSTKYLNFMLDIFAFLGQAMAAFGISIMYAATQEQHENTYPNWNTVCSNASFTTTVTAESPLNYDYIQVGELPSGVELWIIPIALVLISVGYWENFIDSNSKLCFGLEAVNNFRYDIHHARTKIYLIVGVYKIILTFALLMIQHWVNIDNQMDLQMLFSGTNFYDNKCNVYEENVNMPFNEDWLLAAVIQISVGILCFYIADLSVKGYMQRLSLSLPLYLVTPVAFFLLSWACLDCDSYWDFGTYNYWNCYSGSNKIEDLFIGGNNYIWLGIIWFPSFLLLTRYLWFPNAIRLAKLDWYVLINNMVVNI